MTGVFSFCLLLLLPLCTLQSQGQIVPHEAQAAPPPPPQPRGQLDHKENLNTKLTGNQMDSAKVGLFIAASIGIVALMAAVYCIYSKFYTKQQYLHTQLNDDCDFPSDPSNPPRLFFHGSAYSSAADVRKDGYGSICASPSIISVPPSLSPPPCAMPFPPPYLSSHSLRTISARDLQKSCI